MFQELKNLEYSMEKTESINEWTIELNPESIDFAKVVKKKFGFVPLKCIEITSDIIFKHFGVEKLDTPDQIVNIFNEKYKEIEVEILEFSH